MEIAGGLDGYFGGFMIVAGLGFSWLGWFGWVVCGLVGGFRMPWLVGLLFSSFLFCDLACYFVLLIRLLW